MSFAYTNYEDRVSVERIPNRDRWTYQERLSGRPEDVMLVVSDRLRQSVTQCYEHMAWKVRHVEYTAENSWLVVELTKNNYAGD